VTQGSHLDTGLTLNLRRRGSQVFPLVEALDIGHFGDVEPDSKRTSIARGMIVRGGESACYSLHGRHVDSPTFLGPVALRA